ncbi:expressed unknown protein [Seminavis robusta]|uniref:Uncharacterized protein n=1 Tax=Seminavis robusta TaxID=568900 RepID=A0A9N8EB23_9STRA|nr:expressed unknown protein [Seminavis robusta]|eukprot:Sro908_g218830.1 n/a (469) ;mRNA; r:7304-8710
MIVQRQFHATLLVLAAVVLGLPTPHFAVEASIDVEDANVDLSQDQIDIFIEEATSYLVRVCHTKEQDPDHEGKFTYIAYLDEELPLDFTDEEVAEEDLDQTYNLLRHSGTIYSLCLSYKRTADPKVLKAIERSMEFVQDRALGPVPVASHDDDERYEYDVGEKPSYLPDLLAVWETKRVVPNLSNPPKAELGGAGLTLLAMVNLEQILPGTFELTDLRKLANFIQFMQKADGSFYSQYLPFDGGKDNHNPSLFYPGEACLALLYLVSIETDEHYKAQWIQTATRALLYLERYRRDMEINEIEPDHWALIATSKLLPLLNPEGSDYGLIYRHGVRVAARMVLGISKETLLEDDGCQTCTTGDGNTCATAARLEGLIAALTFIDEDELIIPETDRRGREVNVYDRVLFFVRLGVQFLVESQEHDTSNNMQGGVPAKTEEDPNEVRIDYVQHSMSAIIMYEMTVISESESS